MYEETLCKLKRKLSEYKSFILMIIWVMMMMKKIIIRRSRKTKILNWDVVGGGSGLGIPCEMEIARWHQLICF